MFNKLNILIFSLLLTPTIVITIELPCAARAKIKRRNNHCYEILKNSHEYYLDTDEDDIYKWSEFDVRGGYHETHGCRYDSYKKIKNICSDNELDETAAVAIREEFDQAYSKQCFELVKNHLENLTLDKPKNIDSIYDSLYWHSEACDLPDCKQNSLVLQKIIVERAHNAIHKLNKEDVLHKKLEQLIKQFTPQNNNS